MVSKLIARSGSFVGVSIDASGCSRLRNIRIWS
jgi:hypothetical protein